MLLRALTFPVYISEKTPAPFYVVLNVFLVNGLACNNLLSDNELIYNVSCDICVFQDKIITVFVFSYLLISR